MADVIRRTTHNDIKLSITWDGTIRLDMVFDRKGEKISYRHLLDRELADKLLAGARVPNGWTIGEWVERVWQCAAQTDDPVELLKLLRDLPQPGEPLLLTGPRSKRWAPPGKE